MGNAENMPMLANVELERCVVAALMRSGGSLMAIASSEGVTDATFTNSRCRHVYGVICEILKNGGKPDLIMVAAALPGWEVELAEIDSQISTDVNFESWITRLREIEAARNLQTTLAQFSIDAADIPRNGGAAALISKLSAGISDAQRVVENCRVRSLTDIGRSYAEAMMNRDGKEAVPWFPAGTEGDFSVRHRPGRMYVLCAKTGCGKTALEVGAANCQLAKGLVVANFCTETDSEGILERHVSQYCGIPFQSIGDKYPNMDKVRRFAEAMAEFSTKYEGRLFIRGMETGTGSADGIAAEAQRIRREAGRLDVILVDYLQDLRPPKFLVKATKNDQMTYAVDRIHETLIDCDSAGIVLVQLNREGLKTTGMPRLQHIRDSSSIEQKAHAVLFLHRENDHAKETKFYTDKARDQWPFVINLTWNGVGYESKQQYSSEGI